MPTDADQRRIFSHLISSSQFSHLGVLSNDMTEPIESALSLFDEDFLYSAALEQLVAILVPLAVVIRRPAPPTTDPRLNPYNLFGQFLLETVQVARPYGGMHRVILMALGTATHPHIQPLNSAKIYFLEDAHYISAKIPPTMKDTIYSTRIGIRANGITFSRCTCQAGSIICIHSVALVFMIQQAFLLPYDNLAMIEDAFREKHSTSADPVNMTRMLELSRNLHPRKTDSEIMQYLLPGIEQSCKE